MADELVLQSEDIDSWEMAKYQLNEDEWKDRVKELGTDKIVKFVESKWRAEGLI